MWNETNPTSLYLGTTWELISAGKYVKTGSTALQTGGSNSITLSQDNLPNIKLKVNTFSLSTQPHTHPITYQRGSGRDTNPSSYESTHTPLTLNSGLGGGQSTGTATPSTESLGRGTAITIQPEYITLKYWKRTS